MYSKQKMHREGVENNVIVGLSPRIRKKIGRKLAKKLGKNFKCCNKKNWKCS